MAANPILDAASGKDWPRVHELLSAPNLTAGEANAPDAHNGRTLFHLAAGYNQLDILQKLVDLGADRNVKDRAEMTPLHWACLKGHSEIVSYLLSIGCDPSAKVRSGIFSNKTPLGLAHESRRYDIIVSLLGYFNDTTTWKVEELALWLATNSKDNALTPKVQESFNALLQATYVKSEDHSFVAANDEFLKVVSKPKPLVIGRQATNFLPAEEAERLLVLDNELFSSQMVTVHPIILSARPGASSEVLFKKTVFKNEEGKMLLVAVVPQEDPAVGAQGAGEVIEEDEEEVEPDVSASPKPVYRKASMELKASQQGWLLKQGVINRAFRRRWVVLSGASMFYFTSPQDEPSGSINVEAAQVRPEMSKPNCFRVCTAARDYLFMAQSPEEMDSWIKAIGDTVSQLVDAAGRQDWDMVRTLLRQGRSVNAICRYNGRAALHYAAGYGHTEIVNLLAKYGCTINAKDKADMTPLHWAARKGHVETVRTLLANGADVKQRVTVGINAGKTPLDLARDSHQSEVIELLLEKVEDPSQWKVEEMSCFLANHIGDRGAASELDSGTKAGETPALEASLNRIVDPVYVKDMHCRFVVVNDAFCQMLGLSRPEVLDKTAMEAWPAHAAQAADGVDPDLALLSTHGVTECEEEFPLPAGGMRQVITKKTVFETGKGTKILVGVITLTNECYNCGISFTMLNRRHHCRHCGRPVCNKDSSKRITITKFDIFKPVRVCDDCYTSLEGTAATPGGMRQDRSATETLFAAEGGEAVRLEDFTILNVLGKGSFGKVFRVKKRDTNQIFALKTLQKKKIVQMKQVTHVLAEKQIMSQTRHPFVVGLWYAFQTDEKLYMILDYSPGGDLYYRLQREQGGKFNESVARFCAAEIFLALEHIHSCGIVHRDLKAENVLIDSEGHLRLTDFGLAKQMVSDCGPTFSFVGTPEYIAPEILLSTGHGKEVDWWSFGVLLYEMIVGQPPFTSANARYTYERILKEDAYLPSGLSKDAKVLLQGLLQRDPKKRWGAEEIRYSNFFKSINFNKLFAKKIKSPFKPKKTGGNTDLANFDPVMTVLEPAVDSVVEPAGPDLTDFADFDFTPTTPIPK